MVRSRANWLTVLAVAAAPVLAQTPCDSTPAYTPCEFRFELSAADMATHPNPHVSVKLEAQFQSPHFKTYLMPAFWDGRNAMILRFTPTEGGEWRYRFASNLSQWNAKEGTFTAAPSSAAGFIQPANYHHWATENKQPHLWMGYIDDRLAFQAPTEFAQQLDQAASNRFTHFRGSILGGTADRAQVYLGKDKPNPAFFDELDRRLLAVHKRGLIIDLMLASDTASLTALFADKEERERFVRYVVARYAPLNVTWQGVAEWEDDPNGRALLKEIGTALKNTDPYQHPRSTNAKVTSSPLLADGWMNFVIEATTDDAVGSVEHQFYQVPFVGVTDAQHLWNATMDGEYPEMRASSDALAYGKNWYNFIADTRHWELEPYFDIDGGRAVALEDVEYTAYIEHPGPPIEMSVENHGYDVEWFNPATGESIAQKKYKGEHFTGEAPDKSHPWVLLVAREGTKESMLKSVRFDSREVPLIQEIETNPQKVPYTIADPQGGTIPAGKPTPFSAKITRASRATRAMTFLWMAEVPTEGQSYRVIGTGSPGTFTVPVSIARSFPAVLTIRLTALNANGKAYTSERVFTLTQ